MRTLFKPGDTFPSLSLNLTDGQPLAAPEGFSDDYTVVLFFRGHW